MFGDLRDEFYGDAELVAQVILALRDLVENDGCTATVDDTLSGDERARSFLLGWVEARLRNRGYAYPPKKSAARLVRECLILDVARVEYGPQLERRRCTGCACEHPGGGCACREGGAWVRCDNYEPRGG